MLYNKNLQKTRNTPAEEASATFDLRVLATTDIHMQLLGYDYVRNRKLPSHGLAGLAQLIDEAREEAAAEGRFCLLLDNGDTLQGTPLAELLARQEVTRTHPVVASFNALGYDTVGIGNHDLDFGIDYLRKIAQRLNMPMICSNLEGDDLEPLRASALLTCEMPRPDGPPLRLKAGILALLPDATHIWNQLQLNNTVRVVPALESLPGAAADLRAEGADVVILLAHMGIGHDDREGQSVQSLAEVEGIDAIVAGHTHRRFPLSDHTGPQTPLPGSDSFEGRPTVMPGSGGSDLAVLDLTLRQGAGAGWRIIRHNTALRPNAAPRPDPRIAAACKPSHEDTLSYLSEEIGEISAPMHSYFSFATPTKPAEMLARAKALVVRKALKGTVFADLPLLAAAPAHAAGGRSGPDHYLHIPAGPVQRRHVAGLNPYANQIWALRINGAEVRELLEHAVRGLTVLEPGRRDQFLVNPSVPGFNFDTIHGVTYGIDPRRADERIVDLRYRGQPVDDRQEFVLATSHFRAAGGGGFFSASYARVLHRSRIHMEEAIAAAFNSDTTLHWPRPPWHFTAGAPVRALLDTAPEAMDHLSEIAHLAPEVVGPTEEGFLRLRLAF